MGKLILTLITGRSTKQGAGISTGKEGAEYREATSVIELNQADMARSGLSDGDQVRIETEFGAAEFRCRPSDVPEGLAFIAFGSVCNQLIGGETYASGMPDSKHLKVTIERNGSIRVIVPVKLRSGNARAPGNGEPLVCSSIMWFARFAAAIATTSASPSKMAASRRPRMPVCWARAWFLSHGAPPHLPVARIEGKPASLEQGIETAARYLAEARYPLIYGLSSTSCEAQRKSVALAEVLGGCIDCCTSVCHGPSGMALQGVGEPTCTLGEVKNRADLVIYWGSNPGESHPRHMTRYAVTPKGMFVPEGRKGRTVVLVDVRRTPSARAADIFLQIRPGKDFEALWALQALVNGQKLDKAGVARASA